MKTRLIDRSAPVFNARLMRWIEFYCDEAANNTRVVGPKGERYTAELKVLKRLVSDSRMDAARQNLVSSNLTDAQLVRFADAAVTACRNYKARYDLARKISAQAEVVAKRAQQLEDGLLTLLQFSSKAIDPFEDDWEVAKAIVPQNLHALPGVFYLIGAEVPERKPPACTFVHAGELPADAMLVPVAAVAIVDQILRQTLRWKHRPAPAVAAALKSHKATDKLKYLRAFWSELGRAPSLNFAAGLPLKRAIKITANVVLHPDKNRLSLPSDEVTMRDVTDAARMLGPSRKQNDALRTRK